MQIILASKSPRRKELLEQAGFNFIIDSAEVEETLLPTLSPYENVKRLGYIKAQALQEKYPNDIIIGCDTIVVLDGEIYGKPKDASDAQAMLEKLSGRAHQVMSGVAIICPQKLINFVGVTDVIFKELTPKEINDYIASGECFDKAGAYAIQGLGQALVKEFKGSFNNVVGLPIEEICHYLKKVGNGYEVEDR